MNKGTKWHPISEEEFTQAKLLRQAGLKPRHIGLALKRPANTISRLTQFETLAEYRKANMKYRTTQNPRTEAVEEPVVTEALELIQEMTEPDVTANQLDRIATALERSAAAHERLAAAWERSPEQAKRKHLF